MMCPAQVVRNRRAFSLIELVIVVVIIGIIAAIAIPRMSRGAAGANDSALMGNIAVLRKAIDLYAAEHGGAFPGQATVATQLTQYSDASGATAASKDTTHIYGPYIRVIPTLNVGTNKGFNTFTTTNSYTAGFGWTYDATAGTVFANNPGTDVDSANKPYNTY